MNHLSPAEWLTRYILSDRYYSASTNTVKYRAFMPIRNPDTSVLETSVYRISSLEDHEIWSIGETVESQRPGRRLHGRADVILSAVIDQDLNVDPDDSPSRHANIRGWPEEQSKQRLIALKVAAESQLRLRRI